MAIQDRAVQSERLQCPLMHRKGSGMQYERRKLLFSRVRADWAQRGEPGRARASSSNVGLQKTALACKETMATRHLQVPELRRSD